MNLLTQPKGIRPGAFRAELIKMRDGVTNVLTNGQTLLMGPTPVAPAAIEATLTAWIATFTAVDTAQQAYQAAVKARLAITVEARTYYKSLKGAIRGYYFGVPNAPLAAYGIAPDKAIELTSQQKLVAAAKRAQTRKVRGTRGKKQLAAITVVGNPAIAIASDGSQQISPPPVNLPATSSTPTGK